jgi:hypothetical protein
MKIKIGAVLLIILATIGFSGTIAAQHAAEEHTRRKTHGPPRSEANINHIKRYYKSQNHQLDCFKTKDCI